jgi:hypothetical protein
MARPSAQASVVNYELHSLGWKAFQDLCVSIAAEFWGQTVEGFFDASDGGRDGAFFGKWKPAAGEVFEGSFVVQCKFSAKADKQLRASDVVDELRKATRLATKGLADNYFLLTNAHVKGTVAESLRKSFLAIPGVRTFSVYGSERISQMIRESARLRMLVPRVYGLGDLSLILDQRATDQAREILSALGDDLAKFVITDAYRRSAQALVEHGFVLLLGEPACGKSTIAAALAVGALDEWRCSTLKVRDAEDFVAHSNPHEPKQFFWVDDAFGATQFEWSSAADWNRTFPHIAAAIKRGARVLFTSRDYIYRAARRHLKESAFPMMRESQVVIHVDQLNPAEREQILYNHIRLGDQPRAYRTKLKPFLSNVCEHAGFSPEIARRLGTKLFTRGLVTSPDGLNDFVAHPRELLIEIIRTLDDASWAALALVFMRGGSLASPVDMNPDEAHAIAQLGGSIAEIRNALNALEGSLLLQTLQGGRHAWRFKHPTIRDAFAALVAEDRELLDIYLAGTPVDRLMQEVTCGDVGLEGVKVIVPPDRFETFATRLDAFHAAGAGDRRGLHYFLSYRCDRAYLAGHLSRHADFLSTLGFGSYISSWSETGVLVRLQMYGLLPESQRAAAAATIRSLATSTPDADFLHDDVRELLTPGEYAEIMDDVRRVLVPKLDDVISDWRSNYSSDDDPSDHFDSLVGALRRFREALENEPPIVAGIESALERIKEIAMELESERTREPDSDDFRAERSPVTGHDSARSIFDDVDQD